MLNFVRRGHWRDEGERKAFCGFSVLAQQVPGTHEVSWVPSSCLAIWTATPSFPKHPSQMILVMKGLLWDTYLSMNSFPWQNAFQQVPAPHTTSLSPGRHSYPLQQGLDLSPGLVLFLGFSLSALGDMTALYIHVVCISLYVCFPQVDLLLLHSPVIVNNSLYKFSLFKLLCGFPPDYTLYAVAVKHTFFY